MDHPTSSDLAELLHASGRRLTPQRALILSILEETDEHLDAAQILKLSRSHQSELNLTTVYRTLAVLKSMGLVAQRYFARDHKLEYYEAVDKREHYHFTCMECGEIIELHTSRIRQAQQELMDTQGLVISHACVCFEGYCTDCARSREIAHEE